MRKLYDLPPPGERELYVSIFERPVELRPRVELRGYAASRLWEDYRRRMRSAASRPSDGRSRRGRPPWRDEPGPACTASLTRRWPPCSRSTAFTPTRATPARRPRRRSTLVDRLEQEQSRFIANSDVSRINDLSAGQGTRVSPTTMECLEIARRMYDVTGGAFDVSIGSGLDGLDLVAGRVRRRRADAEESAWTWAASARATRSTAWRSCSRSGRSAAPSSTGASARSWPWRRLRTGTAGP